MVMGNFAFSSSRTQKVISLSSCESELRSLVSCMVDGIFICRCLSFLSGHDVDHYQFTDSSSARQLASRQGSGKIRHLSGKVLWVQEKVRTSEVKLGQIPTVFNVSDIGAKSLPRQSMKFLMHEMGVAVIQLGESYGAEEAAEVRPRRSSGKKLVEAAKLIARMSALMGLGPIGADAFEQCAGEPPQPWKWCWLWMLSAFCVVILPWIILAGAWK